MCVDFHNGFHTILCGKDFLMCNVCERNVFFRFYVALSYVQFFAIIELNHVVIL